MRVVVTGASGNIGTALLRRLQSDHPDYQLIGVTRRRPPDEGVYRSVEWHSLDIADTGAADRLSDVFDGADKVVHLAWGFQPTHNVHYLAQVGIHGSRAVLDAAHRSGVAQLVHMSSVGAYAPGRYGRRVDENWPTTGVPTSAYSRHKAAAEAALDRYRQRHTDGVAITRIRPGFVVQRAAASGLARYGLPALTPLRAVGWLPVLPLDRTLTIPLVHAEDVAAAIAAALQTGATGAFNVAADPPIRRADLADSLNARTVHVPARILGALIHATWRARLQPIDRGWLDLAFAVPLLDCQRAQEELGWTPSYSSREALIEVVDAISASAHGLSAPLRRRSIGDQLRRTLRQGPITERHLP